MRLRLLAFVPPAVGVTLLLFFSASSLVSAIEGSLVLDVPAEVHSELIPLRSFETECARLFREIHTLSHRATDCEATPICAGSPLLCPAAMDEEVDQTFQRLRSALHAQCDFSLSLLDYAWAGPVGGRTVCGETHAWFEEAARGDRPPAAFRF